METTLPTRAAVAEGPPTDGLHARRPGGTAARAVSATFDPVAVSPAVYLLDTNIVSELRKPVPSRAFELGVT